MNSMGFYTESHQSITESLCLNETIFIDGLKEGEKLVSLDPFILFNSNGPAIGIDSRFTQFQLLNSKGEVLAYRHLNWTCDVRETSIKPSTVEKSNAYLTIEMVGLMLFVFTVIGIKYVKNH